MVPKMSGVKRFFCDIFEQMFLQIKIQNNKLFYSSENIQKKKGVPDRSVSNNRFSSVTINELATIVRDVILEFQVDPKTDTSPKWVQIPKQLFRI